MQRPRCEGTWDVQKLPINLVWELWSGNTERSSRRSTCHEDYGYNPHGKEFELYSPDSGLGTRKLHDWTWVLGR